MITRRCVSNDKGFRCQGDSEICLATYRHTSDEIEDYYVPSQGPKLKLMLQPLQKQKEILRFNMNIIICKLLLSGRSFRVFRAGEREREKGKRRAPFP